jgi:hypothetical protein
VHYISMPLIQKRAGNLIKRFPLLIVLVLVWLSPVRVYAFPVDELPDDNLIENPWFRSAGNDSGLDGWIDVGGNNKYWSSSQKASNPTGDQISAGPCGSQELYCGTAARLDPTMGKSGGMGIPGVDSYLYQVIEADRTDRKLIFFAHWVSHEIEVAEVSIYGGDSADGPFELVWVPFYHTQDSTIRPARGAGQEDLWENTGFVVTVLEDGNSFYKVEIHARLPEGNSTGFKITGIYLGSAQTDEPPSESIFETPAVSDPPETNVVDETGEPVGPNVVDETGEPTEPIVVEETVVSDARATQAAVRTQMAQESPIPTPAATVIPQASPTPIASVLQNTPSPVIPVNSGNTSRDSNFSRGFLMGGLLVLLLLGGIFITRILFKR